MAAGPSEDRGFDHQYGLYGGAVDYDTLEYKGRKDWHRNDKPCDEKGYATHLIAQEACRVIREKKANKPLFLYLPFTAPHTPLMAKVKELKEKLEGRMKDAVQPARESRKAVETRSGGIVESVKGTRTMKAMPRALRLSMVTAIGVTRGAEHYPRHVLRAGGVYHVTEEESLMTGVIALRLPELRKWKTVLTRLFAHTVMVAGVALALAGAVRADQAGRRHAENELHARPAVRITVGMADADLVGNDNRALQAAVDYVANLGGGTVEIGPGEYRMRDSLHLRSRVTVRGAGEKTVLKKDGEHRSPLAADGDFGEAAITVKDPAGFEIGRGVYVASRSQRYFHGVCATILNARDNYFTLSRSMNADIMVADGGFAATVYPVISGYHLEGARVENLAVDGNRAENPTQTDGCRTAGIFLYRGDNCVISHCMVRDYNGDGISFQQSNDVQVENCVVERCAGLGLHPGSGSQRPLVKNCRAVANGEDGFFFCWRVRGGVVEDNWLENNGGYGMSIGHKDSDNVVRRNTILGNKKGGVYWRAETEPMAAHRVTFENNTVRDNEGFGLFVDGATQGTVIRGNTIEDTGAGIQKTGIRLGKNAGEVVLKDNTVKAKTTLLDERTK